MRILLPGASGGVGSALVQLCNRRGTEIFAVTAASKRDAISRIGARHVLSREDDLLELLGPESIDVVIDNVAGCAFGMMLKQLRSGGRYVHPARLRGRVSLDMRVMYLKDITLIGCTAWDEPVFRNLFGYVERDESGHFWLER